MPNTVVIDLSHHNTVSNLVPTKAAGVFGVIHKATENTGYVDNKLAAREYLARDAGMLFGVYHFLRPGNIQKQAQFFFDTCQKTLTDMTNLLVAADHEDAGVSLDDLYTFMVSIEQLFERSPVLYSGHVLKEQLGSGDERFTQATYRLWLAQYSSNPTTPPGWDEPWIWQWTDKGTVPGVVAPTDCNHYYGGDLNAEWSGRADAIEPPAPPVNITPSVRIYVKGAVLVEVIRE